MRIPRLLISSLAATALGAALPGCAWHKHPRHETPAAQTGPRAVGTIALVNDDLRFVLVDAYYEPPAGTALKSFSGGMETGILAVDPEERRPFIVADIIRGEPKVGDKVEE